MRDAELLSRQSSVRGCVKTITPLLSTWPRPGSVYMPSPHSPHDVGCASIAGPEILRIDRSLVLVEGFLSRLGESSVASIRAVASVASVASVATVPSVRRSVGLGGWLLLPATSLEGYQHCCYHSNGTSQTRQSVHAVASAISGHTSREGPGVSSSPRRPGRAGGIINLRPKGLGTMGLKVKSLVVVVVGFSR